MNQLHRYIKMFTTAKIEEREKQIRHMTSNRYSDSPLLLEKWIEIQKRNPVSWEFFVRQLMAASVFKYDVDRPFSGPTLLITSKQDRLVSYRCTLKLKSFFPNGNLAIHPSAGHDLPLDEPEWLQETLFEFFQKTELGS